MKKLLLLGVFAFAVAARAGEIGFAEDFALAADRAAALKQLIPGTEDYYYYHSLHALNFEDFNKAQSLLKPWIDRFGETPRHLEIQTRLALLTYDRDPQATLNFLRQRLGLHFNYQKETVGVAPTLPTALDPATISRARLVVYSLSQWSNLSNFEPAALDWLAAENLPWERRRELLRRLERPDLATLPELINADLDAKDPPAFGAYPIHKQLTLLQLDELLKLRPQLLNQQAFVTAWLTKIQPGADDDWRHDPASTRAYLDRLLAFTRRLSPAFNGLKAHALYHRLVLDRSQGKYEKELFVEYLKLPRGQGYMAKSLLEAADARRFPAELGSDFSGTTLLAVIGSDEPLVRSYLKHFLVDAASPREYEAWINDIYLRHLFAEVKVEAGLGDSEQWAALLPPEMFRQLKERIDIDFAATNKTHFAVDEPVKLDLFVKNVPNLIVKVFEINTNNYYRTEKKEVDTDINLDGLVANSEKSFAYPEPPLRRMARRFDFPQLDKPGVYVIDFIGAGQSSRALVRKGRLRPLVVTSAAGQAVSVIDESNKLVKDASVWMGGQEYLPGAEGRVVLPFSTTPGRVPIVIRRGSFASLDFLDHQAEALSLSAGIYVDREALLTQRPASVIVRPGLLVNGTPISIKLLEEVKLRIVARDRDGVSTSTEVPNFKLFEDRESVHEFRVPARMAELSVVLEAKVKVLSTGQQLGVAATASFLLNGIAATDKIEDLHLAKFQDQFVVEVLGRTGEPKPDRPVQLSFKHRDFKQAIPAVLKTDAKGQIRLGKLVDISSVTAIGPEGTSETWSMPADRHTYRQVMHAKAGDSISVPYLGTATVPTRDEVALFEVVGDNIRADRFAKLSIKNGLLLAEALPAGDYVMWLKRPNIRIRIRMVAGNIEAGFVLGATRSLRLPPLKPVQIAALTHDAGGLTIRLQDASPFARVHVYASRYVPGYSAFGDLGRVRAPELGGFIPGWSDSVYLTGRNIGDEYRYVLERRAQKKYPGNMLERPALLLNPWAIRSTETGEQLARAGQDFAARGGTVPGAAVPAPKPAGAKPASQATVGGVGFADLDFLADAAAVALNLIPEADGTIKLTKEQLGAHAFVQVVAVDSVSITSRSLALTEPPLKALDLRLRTGLDPQGHFTQQKQVSVLPVGLPFVLADAASGRFEAYDSLPKLFALYATLSGDAKLAEFAFVQKWPELKLDEKLAVYSKHASHELSFFIHQKDPVFFKAVVQPYLANKKDKTFLDRWLLEENLAAYLDPWAYHRLNTVERILLARRLPNEAAKTARHLQELLKMLPPASERERQLYEFAVKGGELEINTPIAAGLPAAFGGGIGADAGRMVAGQRMMEARGELNLADRLTPAPGGPPGGGGALPAKVRDGRSLGKSMADRKKDADGDELKVAEKKQEEALFLNDEDRRKAPAPLYRRINPTQEWAENNYHHLRIQEQLYELVPVSRFWLAFAEHDGKSPFLSRFIAEPSRSFTEIMFALAVTDLPFVAGKHDVKFDGGKMTMTPASPVIAFHEGIRPTAPAAAKVQILVSENFYRHGDRYRDEAGERSDKFISAEFVVQTVYGGHVVVTNPTSSRQRLSVLIQLPVGAVPLANGQFTKSIPLDLEPYRTQTIDFQFYFPKPGQFAHFPTHVARGLDLVAAAAPFTFNVVAVPTKLDTESWQYISQNGTSEQVLAFLNRENVAALDLDKIAFRMADARFFEQVIGLLRTRHAYASTLWSFAILHNAPASAREYLSHADAIVQQCGGPIDAPLLVVDPVARTSYEHLEYKPLVNSRAHALGRRREIVNAAELEQYTRFMHVLAHRKALTEADRLAVVYYLLLQDRLGEALEQFSQINADKLSTRLQYDYCAAYLDMSAGSTKLARSLSIKYANFPVDRWRQAFAAIGSQLDEVEGKAGQVVNADDRDQQQGALAAKEPSIDFNIEGSTLKVAWQNQKTVTVNYYLMDVELLFSRNPFVQQSGGQFASIQPNLTRSVALPDGKIQLDLPLPAEYVKKNVLVEIVGAGKSKAKPYYATAMTVQLSEGYGQLKATDAKTGKPLAKVYVKVYARLADGSVKFHKDGYTDLRGKFDYATVSTPQKLPSARFAMLVLSEDHGAMIQEAAPPQQ